MHKLHEWSLEEQAHNISQSLLPQFTEPFRRREMMQIIGNRDLDYSQSLDEIKQQSMEQTREELAAI